MAAIVISTTTERTAAAIMVPLSVVRELVTSGGKQSGLHRSGSSVVTLGFGWFTRTRAVLSNTSRFNSSCIPLQLKYPQILSTPKSTEILKHSV